MEKFLRTLWQDESGQDMSEYALMVGLVGVFLVAIVILFRDAIGGVFTGATGALNAAPNAPGG